MFQALETALPQMVHGVSKVFGGFENGYLVGFPFRLLVRRILVVSVTVHGAHFAEIPTELNGVLLWVRLRR